jgi:hypothetical protein
MRLSNVFPPQTCPHHREGWYAAQKGSISSDYLELRARERWRIPLSKEVLDAISPDNKDLRCAGVLSPLTDSNRRPPPYHRGVRILNPNQPELDRRLQQIQERKSEWSANRLAAASRFARLG